MTTIRDALRQLLQLAGARYSCVADEATGRVLVELGAADPAAPVAALEWGGAAARYFAAGDVDDLDDLMVTSRRAYHLVRRVAPSSSPPLLVYLCLDRARGNLAAARRELGMVRLQGLLATEAAPSSEVSAPTEASPAAVEDAASAEETASEPEPPVVMGPPPPAAMVPLPRRAPAQPPTRASEPAPPPAPDPVGVQEWATDMGTLRRLLAALRDLA